MTSKLATLPMFLLPACGTGSPPAIVAPPQGDVSRTPTPATTSVRLLKAAMDRGPLRLIDVRTPEEFADARVPGARNIPLGQLADRLDEVSPDWTEPVYLICAAGGRSAHAAQMLADAGFVQPINVTGGTNGWTSAGLPTEPASRAPGDTRGE